LSNLTQDEILALDEAALDDPGLYEALGTLFRSDRVANLLAVSHTHDGHAFVAFFDDVDEAVDFYDEGTDHNASPEIYKIPVIFGSWSKYESTAEGNPQS